MTTAPRAVFVTRETDYDLLLARHATREQARFYGGRHWYAAPI